MQSWGAPLPVTSGYRSPEYNAKVGGAKNSQHLHGNAYDVSTSGLTQAQQIDLINKARASGFGGVGVYDNSLHFDVGAPRAWGSDYTSKTLPSWAASALGSAPAAPQMQNGGQQMADQPMGLLAQLGLQKRDPNATGETAMPFMQRDSFKNTMGNLAIGLNSLRLNPDPNVATIVGNQMQSRKDQQMANKTSQWLMQQPNGQAYVQLIEAGASPSTALSQYQSDMKALAADAAPKIDYKVVDGKIAAINTKTGEVTFMGGGSPLSAVAKLADDLKNKRITQAEYEAGMAGLAPSGMSLQTNPDGTVSFTQGAGQTAKMTEGQGKASGFYNRANKADELLSGFEGQGTDLYGKVAGAIPLAGNYLQSPEYQQFDQAKRDFINAVMRNESGAVIGPDEFANAEQQYFPQPGDSPQVIEQKRKNRQSAVFGLKMSAGAGADTVDASGKLTDASGFAVTGKVGN